MLSQWTRRARRVAGRGAVDRPSDGLFVRLCYEMFLNRPADGPGYESHLGALASGMSRQDLIQSFLQSEEFACRYRGKTPLEALHGARVKYIKTLPAARVILDLGGASYGCPDGALYLMGYPHPSESITIVDVPPPEELRPHVEYIRVAGNVITTERTTARYIFGSMARLEMIPDASVDMVHSGESIEHISEAEADHVIREAYRVLKPGGWFCLDTPNGRLTRLQSPDTFIHPEHQKEYLHHELRDKLVGSGFRIEEQGGICPMPKCLESGRFSLVEMVENDVLHPDPEICYLLYYKCRKPE